MTRIFVGILFVLWLPLQVQAFELIHNRYDLKYSTQDFPKTEQREVVATSAAQYRHGDVVLGYSSYSFYDVINKASDRLIGLDLGYDIGEDIYVSVRAFRFLDRKNDQLHVLGEYNISPQVTVGAHYRDDRSSDWSQIDLLFGYESERGTFGLEVRQWGLPNNRVGFVEAFGETTFQSAKVSAFAGTGTMGNEYHRLGIAMDYGVTDRIGLVGAIGAEGTNSYTTVYTALGANYQISERFRVEGLVGRERFRPNGRSIVDGRTIGVKLVYEFATARSLEDRLDIVLEDTWDRARAFD